MFMNLEVLQLASQPEVLSSFSHVYNCETNRLGMTYGPPTILIKPESSGASPAFVYRFGDDGENLTWTGLMSLSSHKKDSLAAGVQRMSGFDTYYDILSVMYDFEHYCQDGSILYLEKWFSMDSANRFLEDYNFRTHETPISLSRTIPQEVVDLYNSDRFEVPEVFNPLHWEDVPMPQGQLHLFSSREAVKTLPGKDKECARVYLQIPIQRLPKTWENSELRKELEESYKSGRFGDWHKPGKRCYVRENKSEYEALQQTDIINVWSYVQQHKTIFAI
jgi:hypothetical protein